MGDVDLNDWRVRPVTLPLGWRRVCSACSCFVMSFFWLGMVGFVSSVVFFLTPTSTLTHGRITYGDCLYEDGLLVSPAAARVFGAHSAPPSAGNFSAPCVFEGG